MRIEWPWTFFLSAACVGALLWSCETEPTPYPEAQVQMEQPESVENTPLRVGDQAPEFEFPAPGRSEGDVTSVKLSDYRGNKNVLLAFYPKAFTPGCTKQLCGYRDDFDQFRGADTEILAISADNQQESDRFQEEYGLPFPVVGDPEGRIIRAYGVPLRGGYASRSVFLIDKTGIIRHINLAYNIENDRKQLDGWLAKLAPGSEAGVMGEQQ